MCYNWNNGNGCQQGDANVQYSYDLAAVLREYSQGLLQAFLMGRCAAEQERLLLSTQPNVAKMQTKGNTYTGIFDNRGYGVYDSQEAINRSEPYWDKETVSGERFNTEIDALNFARNGLAALRQIDVNLLPDMQYPINWRQVI